MATALGKGVLSGVLMADQLGRQRATDSRNDLLLGMQLQSSVAETARKTDQLRRERQFSQDSADAFDAIFTEVDVNGNRVLKNLNDADGLKASMEYQYNTIASGLRNGMFNQDQVDKAFATVDGLKKQGLDKLVQGLIINPTDEVNSTKLVNKLNLPKGTSFNVTMGGGGDPQAGGKMFTPKFTALIPNANGQMEQRDITPYFQAVAIQSISNIMKANEDELNLQKKDADIGKVVEETNKIRTEDSLLVPESKSKRKLESAKTKLNLARVMDYLNPAPEELVELTSSKKFSGKPPTKMPSSDRITTKIRGFATGLGLNQMDSETIVADVTNQMRIRTDSMINKWAKANGKVSVNKDTGAETLNLSMSEYNRLENQFMEGMLDRVLDEKLSKRINMMVQVQNKRRDAIMRPTFDPQD